MAKKVVFLLIALAVAAGAAGALELNIGFDPALLSGTGKYAKGLDTSIAPGFTVAADFFPGKKQTISIGPELGFFIAPISSKYGDGATALIVPIAFRLGWHLKFIKVDNLDVYVLGKFGFAPGSWIDDGGDSKIESPFELVYGFNLGGKYFFTPKLGGFVEAGFNHYGLDVASGGYIVLETSLVSYARLGVSFKF